MKQIFPALLIASILLTACGKPSSLWGSYSTPTAEINFPTPFAPDPPKAADTATRQPTPFITSTFTPTVIPQSPTPGTPAPLTPGIQATFTPTFNTPSILYYSQSGDTLPALAARFNVSPSEIRSDAALPKQAMLPANTLLVIPKRIKDQTTPNIQIIPDSELVFSATAIDFDIAAYVNKAGGDLSAYREYLLDTGWMSGASEIKRTAYENSINPRILLGVLEYESHAVRGQYVDALHKDYPMGFTDPIYKGVFSQLVWAVNQLSIGYYGWRTGSLTQLNFTDGSSLRIDPRLNAGTVAIQYLFSKQHSQSQWSQIMDPINGFPAVYSQMFGDVWARGGAIDPIFPANLTQPQLSLPFQPNVQWNFTGGPHGAWEHDGSLAALDFAPANDHAGCSLTTTWITAAAPGLIVRSGNGVVVEDLDGDGYEQTGWNLLYLHVATLDRVPAGTWVQKNDRIGHASCEGGIATGTHLHFARKYNGEWIAADGPIPFDLSGWVVHQGSKPYEGTLTNGSQTVIADPFGQAKSTIFRSVNDP